MKKNEENENVKTKLNDYATTSAWNTFYDNGGKVEDYNRYNEIKQDIEQQDRENKKQEEIKTEN